MEETKNENMENVNANEMKEKDEHKTYKELVKEIKESDMKGLSEQEKIEMRGMMKESISKITMGESSFQIEDYININTEIEIAAIEESTYGLSLKMETKVLGIYKDEAGNEIQIRGRVFFPLYVDENNNIRYRPKSKLGKFIKRHEIDNMADLIGCKVLTVLKEGEKSDYINFI